MNEKIKKCIETLLCFVDNKELDIALSVNEDMRDPREIVKEILRIKKKKIINMIIDGCKDCPYCQYIDEIETGWYCRKIKNWGDEGFISESNPERVDIMTPIWCPLEEV